MDYLRLVEVYERLENTSARLKKIEAIADLLESTEADVLDKVVLLLEGRVFPSYSEKEIGIASQMMVKILATSTGFSADRIVSLFKKSGDFGLVAEELIAKKRQQTLFHKHLDIEKVFENLQKLAGIEGKGSQERKFQMVAELISHAGPKEAKFIVRTTIGDLRVGVAEGVVRDAIAKAFFSDILWSDSSSKDERITDLIKGSEGRSFVFQEGLLDTLASKGRVSKDALAAFRRKNKVHEKALKEIERTDPWKGEGGPDFLIFSDAAAGSAKKTEVADAVEWAWYLRSDYGEVARISREKGLKGLKRVSLQIGKPYHVLLCEKAKDLEEALAKFERPSLEFKYDGARVILHKKGDRFWFYTRRLENITLQFPDLRRLAEKAVKPDECILEGEMLAINPKTGTPLPFQLLSQRIKRKYDIDKVEKEIPIQVNVFDIVYLDGRELFDEPLENRRKLLEKSINPIPGKFQLAEMLVTKDLKKAGAFYEKALKAKQEGVIIKNLDAKYQPGRRVGFWLKVKPIMETLDLAIIGATWGTGKRAGWMGSLFLGCRDPDSGKFLECGMIGTGIKEKEGEEGDVTFEQLTNLLKPNIISEKGSEVSIKPKVIVEVAYEEIQKSPNYSSGYALRFPRVVRIRFDKSPQDADSLDRLEGLYGMQRGKR